MTRVRPRRTSRGCKREGRLCCLLKKIKQNTERHSAQHRTRNLLAVLTTAPLLFLIFIVVQRRTNNTATKVVCRRATRDFGNPKLKSEWMRGFSEQPERNPTLMATTTTTTTRSAAVCPPPRPLLSRPLKGLRLPRPAAALWPAGLAAPPLELLMKRKIKRFGPTLKACFLVCIGRWGKGEWGLEREGRPSSLIPESN